MYSYWSYLAPDGLNFTSYHYDFHQYPPYQAAYGYSEKNSSGFLIPYQNENPVLICPPGCLEAIADQTSYQCNLDAHYYNFERTNQTCFQQLSTTMNQNEYTEFIPWYPAQNSLGSTEPTLQISNGSPTAQSACSEDYVLCDLSDSTPQKRLPELSNESISSGNSPWNPLPNDSDLWNLNPTDTNNNVFMAHPSLPSSPIASEQDPVPIPRSSTVKKKKRRLTAKELSVLKDHFKKERYPRGKGYERLAIELGLTVRKVSRWFERQRQIEMAKRNPPNNSSIRRSDRERKRAVLLKHFNECPYPDSAKVDLIAKQLGMSAKQVSNWFGNTRRDTKAVRRRRKKEL